MLPATESRRILQERCGKVTVSCRNRPEIMGKNPKTFWLEFLGTGRFRASLLDLRIIKLVISLVDPLKKQSPDFAK
jgi:hypothetical protein